MPNWCAGNIRLRGKRAAILEFLKNELESTGYASGDLSRIITGPLEMVVDDCDVDVRIPEARRNLLFAGIYIKGTRRNFIKEKDFYVYLDDEREKNIVCIDGFEAAWTVEAEPYLEKARRYGIDIRIVAFEKGMQFMSVIEIVDGKIVENSETSFDDWYWDCPMPNMGG